MPGSSGRPLLNGLLKWLTHHTGPDFIIWDCEKKEISPDCNPGSSLQMEKDPLPLLKDQNPV